MNPVLVAPAVLVAVGTDVHPFDRLMSWLGDWYATRADRPAMLVQHGHTAPAGLPGAVPFLDHASLRRAMATATLVVCHAGPATIVEARSAGRLPLVVARDPDHGEHVDDHQQRFARRMAEGQLIRLCETATELATELDTGLAEPGRLQLESDPVSLAARHQAAARVGQIVEDLIRPGSAGRRWPKAIRDLRRRPPR